MRWVYSSMAGMSLARKVSPRPRPTVTPPALPSRAADQEAHLLYMSITVDLPQRLVQFRQSIEADAAVSKQIREIFGRYTPLVEPLSLDEAFLDVGGSEGLFGPAPEIGRRIKREIRDELRLVASVGVAPNKFLAKVASDENKPDGITVVPPHAADRFIDRLPIRPPATRTRVCDRSTSATPTTSILETSRRSAVVSHWRHASWPMEMRSFFADPSTARTEWRKAVSSSNSITLAVDSQHVGTPIGI